MVRGLSPKGRATDLSSFALPQRGAGIGFELDLGRQKSPLQLFSNTSSHAALSEMEMHA